MVDTTDSPGPALRKPTFLKPAFLSTQYNDFLFASIGADASGTYLTVVSALARLDLDPWAEAAKFARMPGSVATQKLAELVSRFTEIPPARVDSAKIAARLTALLPANLRSGVASGCASDDGTSISLLSDIPCARRDAGDANHRRPDASGGPSQWLPSNRYAP